MTARATSERGKAVITELALLIEQHEFDSGKRTKRRSTRASDFQGTLGAIIGELLYATTIKDVESWLSWPLDRNVYTDLSFSHRDVTKIVEGLTALGIIEVNKGKPFLFKDPWNPNGTIGRSSGYITTLRMTQRGLDWFSERGLAGSAYADDFDDTVPLNAIVLRDSSRRIDGKKIKGSVRPITKSAKTRALIDQVKRLNEFLLKFELRPIAFRGLYRGFNEADRPDFDFDRGGRLYGFGNSYQLQSEAARLHMTIDGEPVAEIDISSSYLTIVYGLFGYPMDKTSDQYSVGGYERELVKKWTSATLSAGELTRWPNGTPEEYKARTGEKIPSIANVKAAMESRHPVLAEWAKSPGTWSTLMFLESGVVIETMETLMAIGLPSYPVHDSIIVREKDAQVASDTLANVFL